MILKAIKDILHIKHKTSSITNDKYVTRLIGSLNKACHILNNKYHINCGGCCFAAYCVAQLLEKAKIDFYLVVFDYDYEFYRETNLSDLKTSFNHYAIRVKLGNNNLTVNGGNYRKANYKEFKVTSEDILNHYKGNLWNTFYNTANNRKVQTTIEQTYYEFTKNLRKI